MDSKKAILILGGSGEIGQSIIKELISKFGENYEYISTYCNKKNDFSGLTELQYNTNSDNKNFIAYVKKRQISHVFFCIGISCRKDLITTSLDTINNQILVNAISFLDIYKKLVENFRNNNTKFIVLSSSTVIKCRSYYGAYSISKLALEAIVRTLANEEAPYKVSFHIIRFSIVDTDLAKTIVNWEPYHSFEKYIQIKLKGNILKANDVATAIINYINNSDTQKNSILTIYNSTTYEEILF